MFIFLQRNVVTNNINLKGAIKKYHLYISITGNELFSGIIPLCLMGSHNKSIKSVLKSVDFFFN